MKKYLLFTLVIAFFACNKKTADTPLVEVPERLEISPSSSSIAAGGNQAYNLKFYNSLGQPASTPTDIMWSSSNETIATVAANGSAKGISGGQVTITARYKNATASALLTVAATDTGLATITITPSDLHEIRLNETSTLMAMGKTNTGATVNGLVFNWSVANTNIATISNAGVVTGVAYGTTNITVSANNIQSSPLMLQVIRKGNFSGSGSTGTAKLKIENGVLKLQTSADFSVSNGAPDLRIYLGNNSSNVNGALEVASLNQRSGAQSWNLPATVSITQYRYAIVWCKQFGGTYGVADFGN